MRKALTDRMWRAFRDIIFPRDRTLHGEPSPAKYTDAEIQQVLGHSERVMSDPGSGADSYRSVIVVLIRVVRQLLNELEWRDYP